MSGDVRDKAGFAFQTGTEIQEGSLKNQVSVGVIIPMMYSI